MKIKYMHAEIDLDVLDVVKSAKLPKKIGLVSTIQFLKQLKKVKSFLEKKGHKVFIGGQVLGCDVVSANKLKSKVDCFLYVGSGRFHPIEVARQTKKEVFIANPLSKGIAKISKSDIEKEEKKLMAKKVKFLMAKKIGILVSLKNGQFNLNKALEFQSGLKKESYIFIGDEINDLENFPDIDFWVNSACPRIEGKGIIDLGKLPMNLK